MKTRKERKQSKTDWERLQKLSCGDEEIDLTDIPEISDDSWANSVLHSKPKKKAISVRLDEDVIEYLKNEGPNYQTRMNEILRKYVEFKRGRADNHR